MCSDPKAGIGWHIQGMDAETRSTGVLDQVNAEPACFMRDYLPVLGKAMICLMCSPDGLPSTQPF